MYFLFNTKTNVSLVKNYIFKLVSVNHQILQVKGLTLKTSRTLSTFMHNVHIVIADISTRKLYKIASDFLKYLLNTYRI